LAPSLLSSHHHRKCAVMLMPSQQQRLQPIYNLQYVVRFRRSHRLRDNCHTASRTDWRPTFNRLEHFIFNCRPNVHSLNCALALSRVMRRKSSAMIWSSVSENSGERPVTKTHLLWLVNCSITLRTSGISEIPQRSLILRLQQSFFMDRKTTICFDWTISPAF
jgi:hypothetical protein